MKKYSGKGVDQKFTLLPDDTSLIADGADTTRVVLRVTDEFDAIRPFANDAIKFELEGPAEIIGDNPFALVGGTGAVWIRAKEQAGTVRLTATHPVLGKQQVEFAIAAAASSGGRVDKAANRTRAVRDAVRRVAAPSGGRAVASGSTAELRSAGQPRAAVPTWFVPLYFLPQQIFDVADFFSQQIQLAGQALNLRLGAAVDVVVEFAAQAVFCVLPVLAHHDDRRLNGGQHGEEQVQQNEWIGIPCDCRPQDDIDGGVDA